MRIVQMLEKEHAEYKHYLILLQEEYKNNPSEKLQQAIDQTLDTIEIQQEYLDELK